MFLLVMCPMLNPRRALLQRLATGATGVKQARYRRGPTRGSEALYAHAQYNTQPVGPWYIQCMVNSAEGFAL